MTPLNTIIEEEVEAYKNDYAQAITDVGGFGLAKHIERFLTTAMQRACEERDTYWKERVREEVEGMKKPEKEIEQCENCGEEGYGKAWYGRGRETGDAWGDRYIPTGSVVFCKTCKPQFRIGAEWNGEEIWKTTSDSPEHDQLRISRITKTVNVEHNQALDTLLDNLK